MSIGTQNHSNQEVYDTGLRNNAHVTPAAINQAAEEQLAAASALAEQTYRPLVEAAANGGNASTPRAPTPEPQELSQQSTLPRTLPPRRHQDAGLYEGQTAPLGHEIVHAVQCSHSLLHSTTTPSWGAWTSMTSCGCKGTQFSGRQRFRKYYKSLVLGLIDMAIVSGCIVHKAYYKNKTTRPLSHVKYMKKLHMQLCALQAVDMYESNTFGTREPIPAPRGAVPTVQDTTAHTMRQIERWRNADTPPKRCRGACKVCSILHAEGNRAATSKYFCLECNNEGSIFLCRSARYPVRGVAMTCWDIWHREWSNGQLLPVDNGRSIRIRPATAQNEDAPSTPGTPATPASRNKRRRTGTPV
ncbi:unnamed protein product [Phytophthora fragariaefolia]|uniref:Unnamed protein product n=1 Tax=Phytophthora fragariaefolia TaxID=1490495 RepID=A0A9W6Y695_9STRA|nr:unnamed protein product [Phytophthora fragariaefolia]